jgi:hypothetical protein
MTFDKWAVLAGGIVAIVSLNWHFFRSVRRGRNAKRD